MAADRDVEDQYRRLASNVDLHILERHDWRAVCAGKERPIVQELLLQLAEGAQSGTQSDRLALYKAAYAVLPLHGQPLKEFVLLLIREHPISLDWADVLLHALSEETNSVSSLSDAISNALHEMTGQPASMSGDQRKIRWIHDHLRLAGCQFDWLPENTEPTAPAPEEQEADEQDPEEKSSPPV